MDVDAILEGSIDLHAHGYPEVSMDFPGPGHMESCVEWAREAREAGMAGFLIKSHVFPSITLAHTVDAEVDAIDVYGSTVLNPTSGSIDELTAEIAGRLDSAIVYMPTWSAANDIDLGGMSAHAATFYDHFDPTAFDGLRVAEDGELTPEAAAALDELARHDVTIGTGHISPAESLVLTEAAVDRGLDVVMNHPTSGSTDATVEETREIAAAGATIEFVTLGTVEPYRRISYEGLADFIGDVGIEDCLVATDAFSEDCPSPPALMRQSIEHLAAAGLSAAELRTLTHDNPRRALGI